MRNGNLQRRMSGGTTRFGVCVAALFAFLAADVREAAAVSVSPMSLYMDARTRSGSLNLHNTGNLPEEIEISFAFGYPVSDVEGRMSLQLFDEVPQGARSAAEWLRVFPRRIVLQPGQRQIVRVMVDPPAGLAEGEYWARILVRSRGGQPPIEQTEGDVSIQISVETIMAVAFSYRHGSVDTGVELVGASLSRSPEGLVADAQLRRQGNAAYLGRLRAELLDAAGNVVDSREDPIAVYHDALRRVVFQLPENRRGPFQVRLRLDTTRDDLPRGAVLPAQAVSVTLREGESG
jgi:P pilus assembly chaperone PapD